MTALLTIKLAVKYAQLRDVESMRAIARAHQDRNLAEFEKALRDYKDELSSDATIRSHLSALYDKLLEQNLLRIVEPYSAVEIEYIAMQVGQARVAVEDKWVAWRRVALARIIDANFQAIADDIGQSTTRCTWSRPRLSACVWQARGRRERIEAISCNNSLNLSQEMYADAIATLEQVGKVVDSLYAKVRIFKPSHGSEH